MMAQSIGECRLKFALKLILTYLSILHSDIAQIRVLDGVKSLSDSADLNVISLHIKTVIARCNCFEFNAL